MNIYSRNANALLFEKASLLREQPHISWRAIRLNLSQQQELHNPALRTYFIAHTMGEILTHDEGSIYLCADGDAIILFQGPMKPVLAKLGAHFAEIKLAQLARDDEDGLFTIYDLSKDWNQFFELCRAKCRKPAPAWPLRRQPAYSEETPQA